MCEFCRKKGSGKRNFAGRWIKTRNIYLTAMLSHLPGIRNVQNFPIICHTLNSCFPACSKGNMLVLSRKISQFSLLGLLCGPDSSLHCKATDMVLRIWDLEHCNDVKEANEEKSS